MIGRHGEFYAGMDRSPVIIRTGVCTGTIAGVEVRSCVVGRIDRYVEGHRKKLNRDGDDHPKSRVVLSRAEITLGKHLILSLSLHLHFCTLHNTFQ